MPEKLPRHGIVSRRESHEQQPQVITESDQLCQHVAGLWPRYKFTPELAASRIRRLRRHGLMTICDALTEWEADNPDERAPNWRQIGALLAKRASRRVRGRPDGANYYRHWFAHPEECDVPSWAQELLDVDEEGNGLELCHWECWYAAAQTMAGLACYHLRHPWPSGDAARDARAVKLRTAHFQVRNLTTFGSATERRKAEWLARIDADALAGDVLLER